VKGGEGKEEREKGRETNKDIFDLFSPSAAKP